MVLLLRQPVYTLVTRFHAAPPILRQSPHGFQLRLFRCFPGVVQRPMDDGAQVRLELVTHSLLGCESADPLRATEAGHLAPYRRGAVSLSRFRGGTNATCPDLVPFVPMD